MHVEDWPKRQSIYAHLCDDSADNLAQFLPLFGAPDREQMRRAFSCQCPDQAAYLAGVNVAVIDSNAVDPLVDDEGVRETIRGAISDGRLRLFSTHVASDEIGATGEATRRHALLTAVSDVSEVVPTGAFVLVVSRIDMARLSDDVEGFEAQRAVSRSTPRTRRSLSPRSTKERCS